MIRAIIMKLLMITTIAGTQKFFLPLIRELTDRGVQVDIACSRSETLHPDLKEISHAVFDIPFSRSPLSRGNLTAKKQLKGIVEQGEYDIVHCHTPVAALCTRLACRKSRKKGLKVVYTAHGFHFYKGAPLKNWLIFYPAEWLCSFWTDLLITITSEDFKRAQKKMHAKRTEYLPGVGIDVEKFQNVSIDKSAKRREIGVPANALLLLSVGELNTNKNHSFVIRLLSRSELASVHCAVAGDGEKDAELKSLALESGVKDRVHLLGRRNDVAELLHAADVYLLPSIREGLNVSVMEAMSAGLPVVCNDIRGNDDLIKNGEGGFLCALNDEGAWLNAICALAELPEKRGKMGEYNIVASEQYSMGQIIEKTLSLYREITE